MISLRLVLCSGDVFLLLKENISSVDGIVKYPFSPASLLLSCFLLSFLVLSFLLPSRTQTKRVFRLKKMFSLLSMSLRNVVEFSNITLGVTGFFLRQCISQSHFDQK